MFDAKALDLPPHLPTQLSLLEGRERGGFSNLPGELLLEVFQYLDLESLCSIKQTCRTWYYTTKSRQLWCGFVERLQESSFQRPEESLDSYSTEELEKWVLLRLRSQTLWKLSTFPTFHFRSFRTSTSHTPALYRSILPGGRWLLTITSERICVVDLDAHQPEPQNLGNPGKYSQTGRMDSYAQCCYSIDDSRPRLSFRIGLCSKFPAPITNPGQAPHILVYQVDIKGHGSDAKLVADPILWMRSHGIGLGFICLNTEYVVEFICQVDYRRGDATSNLLRSYHYTVDGVEEKDIKPFTLVVSNFINKVDFISHNRIIAFGNHDLHIFGIHPSDNEVNHAIHILYTVAMSVPSVFSCVYRSPHSASKVLVLTNGEVKGVNVPDNDPSTTTVQKIGDYPYYQPRLGSKGAVGPSTGVIVHENKTVDLLSFTWEEGVSVTTFNQKSRPLVLGPMSQVLISSDLGRVVVVSRGYHYATTLDLTDYERVIRSNAPVAS